MLLHAAHFGHAAIVELLLEHGADADAGDERGRTYAPGRAAGCAARCRRSSTLWTRMLKRTIHGADRIDKHLAVKAIQKSIPLA